MMLEHVARYLDAYMDDLNIPEIEFDKAETARSIATNGKIYDITHPDINEHTVGLPTGYPENTRRITCVAVRIGGTGVFQPKSVTSGTITNITNNYIQFEWIRATDGLFYYSLSIANDDWDIYSQAYMVSL